MREEESQGILWFTYEWNSSSFRIGSKVLCSQITGVRKRRDNKYTHCRMVMMHSSPLNTVRWPDCTWYPWHARKHRSLGPPPPAGAASGATILRPAHKTSSPARGRWRTGRWLPRWTPPRRRRAAAELPSCSCAWSTSGGCTAAAALGGCSKLVYYSKRSSILVLAEWHRHPVLGAVLG